MYESLWVVVECMGRNVSHRIEWEWRFFLAQVQHRVKLDNRIRYAEDRVLKLMLAPALLLWFIEGRRIIVFVCIINSSKKIKFKCKNRRHWDVSRVLHDSPKIYSATPSESARSKIQKRNIKLCSAHRYCVFSGTNRRRWIQSFPTVQKFTHIPSMLVDNPESSYVQGRVFDNIRVPLVVRHLPQSRNEIGKWGK